MITCSCDTLLALYISTTAHLAREELIVWIGDVVLKALIKRELFAVARRVERQRVLPLREKGVARVACCGADEQRGERASRSPPHAFGRASSLRRSPCYMHMHMHMCMCM